MAGASRSQSDRLLVPVWDEVQAARTLSISWRTASATGHSQKEWSVALMRLCRVWGCEWQWGQYQEGLLEPGMPLMAMIQRVCLRVLGQGKHQA